MVPEARAPDRSMAGPTLLCRLRFRQSQPGQRPLPRNAAEVELENVSDSVIEIPVTLHPLQYLDLIVTRPDGELVSAFYYGNHFSPSLETSVLRLRPGETYVAPVSLLGTVPPEKQLPGSYLVRAVYQCGELRAESEPLQVSL
jgi:hypothetical protein